jgi:hypothetical protein
MNQKNDDENSDINKDNNDDDSDIEYDFTSEKTKSLNKFPSKMLKSDDFYLDETSKNFSKSLKFNSHKCYAPKPKIKQSSKSPSPIIYEKQSNIININTKEKTVIEDALTEKEQSLDNESSYSSDFENINNNKNNINNDSAYSNQFIGNNNYIISKNLLEISDKKNKDKNEGLYENKINIIEDSKDINNLQSYNHKTISSFPIKKYYSNTITKWNMKAIRSSLFRAKMKSLKEKFREVEYSIKEKMKIKYGLDIKNNRTKKKGYNADFCKIIPINNNKNEEDKKEEEIEDMSSFRKTISYNVSKFNLEKNKNNEDKGITIYDVLITNKKNKNEKIN